MSSEDGKTIVSWIKWGLGIIVPVCIFQASLTFANTSKIAKNESGIEANKERIYVLDEKFTYWLELDDINNSAIIAHLDGDTEELKRLMDESRRIKLRIIRSE